MIQPSLRSASQKRTLSTAGRTKHSRIMAAQSIRDAVAEQEAALAGSGRVLVRPSGTEALIRVMVEAATQDDAQKVAEHLANVIKKY